MKTKFDPRFGEIINHQASGFNLDDVAKELSINIENIVKAIILEYNTMEPIVGIVRSVDRLKTKNIKRITGKKYSFMSEEHLRALDLSPGAIPPFIGFQLHFQTYIDTNISQNDYFYGSGGSVFSACKFLAEDYLRLGAMFESLSGKS